LSMEVIRRMWAEGKPGVEYLRDKIKEHFSLEEKKPDVVALLGGDGTILENAKKYPESPLLPFRKLSFGALADLEETDIDMAFEKLRKGEYEIEEVMRLEVEYKDLKTWGLNDIVIHRDDEFANKFRVFCDGLDTYDGELIGDALIVATPLGSTGYNWTAGGKILSKCEGKFIVTPICCAFFNRTIYQKGRRVMEKVEGGKTFSDDKEVIVVFNRDVKNKIVPDGRQKERLFINIEVGDEIAIRRAEKNSKFVRIK
jgi:NAD+ kinase